jgi:hypothetical protein
VNVQETPDPSIEIHPASLNAISEQGALTDIEYLPDHSQTVGMGQTSNADTITNFNLCH